MRVCTEDDTPPAKLFYRERQAACAAHDVQQALAQAKAISQSTGLSRSYEHLLITIRNFFLEDRRSRDY